MKPKTKKIYVPERMYELLEKRAAVFGQDVNDYVNQLISQAIEAALLLKGR